MTVVLGIDPGSRSTGYGVIQLKANRFICLAHGFLSVSQYPCHERLQHIYFGIKKIIETYQPEEAAIEQIFMHDNPNSALKLGQARGAAMVALTIPMAEYSSRQVKKSVVGSGGAAKDQVQFMVKHILQIKDSLQADAADALAVAICHLNSRSINRLIAERMA